MYRADDKFVVHWTRYVDNSEDHKLQFQAHLYHDGKVVFVYKNLLNMTKEAAKQTGYPVLIGLQDSFAVQNGSGKNNEPTTLRKFAALLYKVGNFALQ